MTEEDLERAFNLFTEAKAPLSSITRALIPAAEFADLKMQAERHRRYTKPGTTGLRFYGIEIRPSFSLPCGSAAFYSGSRLIGIATVREEPMTEEQADNETKTRLAAVYAKLSPGWDKFPEHVEVPLPTVGTPEYEPTEPSPARLPGGAN